MVKLAILGAAGRMGKALISCAERVDGVEVVAAIEIEGSPLLGVDAGLTAGVSELGVEITSDMTATGVADVVIDFTFHEASPLNAERAAEFGQSIIIGTTGLTDEEADVVKKAAEKIPIVWAPNMSLGVNLLFAMVEKAGSILGVEYDVEIVETHHKLKKDAPSGTALRLAEQVAAGRLQNLEDVGCYGRQGLVGERPVGEIGVHAVRAGDVVGDHTVTFAIEGERIEFTHRASSRDTFAMGAVKTAKWVADKKPGLYDMQDVLGLRE
ncbi:MAG: 4-hydroxy-tetrahydrodipicolinate reductase [Kiritimatiellae bacterium]|nr:4-hydroxy-tetrahydrodipicolinate reductase [Kiritimatiellia bacterium]